jgi:putative ABC transport system permease protein
MSFVALRMLVGDRAKYLAIVVGLTFTALLLTQQLSIFVGLLERSYSPILDLRGQDLWVMDPRVSYVDDWKAMPETQLHRVRGVPGVESAVPLFRVFGTARIAGGEQKQVAIIGLDDASLTGAPEVMVEGTLEDLRRPDAVIVDENGAREKFNGARIGTVLELNDRRAEIVGICKARRTFTAFPAVYTTYSRSKDYRPAERNMLSYILVKLAKDADVERVKADLAARTGLVGLTEDEFCWKSVVYITKNTGIPVIFGVTVLLGFVIGTAIAGQTLYTFTLENLRHYGALKAMGATNTTVVGMVLLQTSVVSAIGYGIGAGGGALFGHFTEGTPIAFHLRPEILLVTAAAIVVVAVGSSLLSIRRLVTLDPAIVFRG